MKWARTKADRPRSTPQLPQLTVMDSDGRHRVATTLQEKFEILRNQFFPEPREASLEDIPGTIYPEPLEMPLSITIQEIYGAIRWVTRDKTLGPD